VLGCLSLYSSLLFWSPLVVLLLLSILSSDSMRGVPGGLGYLFLFLEKIFRSSLWTLGHTLQFGLLITPVSRGNLPRKMVPHHHVRLGTRDRTEVLAIGPRNIENIHYSIPSIYLSGWMQKLLRLR